MTLNKSKIILIFVLLALTFSSGAKAEVNVVTTIKPLHSIVSAIMVGTGAPKLLMRTTVSPHDFKLKPSDVRALNKADVIFWFGPSLESRLSKVIEIARKTSRVFDILKSPNIKLLKNRNHEDDHDHGLNDPHIWTSIPNAKAIAFIVRDTLMSIEPKHAKTYSSNYQKFSRNMDHLESTIRQRMKSTKKVPFVVYHDSFQYFENDFQLNSHGAIMISAEHRPGAKRLSTFRKMIKEKKISCVFSELHHNQKMLHSIIKGSAAKITLLDPIGANLKPGQNLYGDLMKNLSSTMANCLEYSN